MPAGVLDENADVEKRKPIKWDWFLELFIERLGSMCVEHITFVERACRMELVARAEDALAECNLAKGEGSEEVQGLAENGEKKVVLNGQDRLG